MEVATLQQHQASESRIIELERQLQICLRKIEGLEANAQPTEWIERREAWERFYKERITYKTFYNRCNSWIERGQLVNNQNYREIEGGKIEISLAFFTDKSGGKTANTIPSHLKKAS